MNYTINIFKDWLIQTVMPYSVQTCLPYPTMIVLSVRVSIQAVTWLDKCQTTKEETVVCEDAFPAYQVHNGVHDRRTTTARLDCQV